MIAGITGKLVRKDGDRINVATETGVTYELSIPLGVLERLPREGGNVDLETVMVVREDSMTLFGFDRQGDRIVFQKLLAASGVGPKLALAMLSALGGDRVVRGLRDGDIGLLSTVPGVGRKTAERLIVELKDRVKGLSSKGPDQPSGPPDQAIQALVNLGYSLNDADKAVKAVVARENPSEVSEIIRKALQQVAKSTH